jgi:hypothetical protein
MPALCETQRLNTLSDLVAIIQMQELLPGKLDTIHVCKAVADVDQFIHGVTRHVLQRTDTQSHKDMHKEMDEDGCFGLESVHDWQRMQRTCKSPIP